MRGEPALLAALLRNLLDNALRYGRRGGAVRVRTGAAADGIELVVEDDGPGIPPAERERVFERFHRMADATASGSGLGLSIARRIAELHGGQVVIEDPASGTGTRIRASFPGGA
jgi:signal transduction histidine kinase